VARYATYLGPDKNQLIPRDASNHLTAPTSLVADAHRAGLLVTPYTFRNENNFLSADLQRGTSPADYGNAIAEYVLFFEVGVDACSATTAIPPCWPASSGSTRPPEQGLLTRWVRWLPRSPREARAIEAFDAGHFAARTLAWRGAGCARAHRPVPGQHPAGTGPRSRRGAGRGP